MKLRFSNPLNLLLSLLALLPVFRFPIRYPISWTGFWAALGLLLLFQLLFNTGHQASNKDDPHGKAMEHHSIHAMQNFIPISPRGSGGMGVSGPTRNIQATDSQGAQLLSWLIVLAAYFMAVIAASDRLHGIGAGIDFVRYLPLFAAIAGTAVCDLLLTSRFGKVRQKALHILAGLCLAALWIFVLV